MAASDPGAGAGVERHEREGAEAEEEEKDIKHGGSLPDEGRPGRLTIRPVGARAPFGFPAEPVRAA